MFYVGFFFFGGVGGVQILFPPIYVVWNVLLIQIFGLWGVYYSIVLFLWDMLVDWSI